MDNDFNMFDDSTVGSLKISEDVIATIARVSALEIDGVADVSLSSTGVKGFLSKSANLKAVKVDMDGDAVGVEINLIVEFGSRIPDIAAAVQRSVKSSIETITGLSTYRVDIVVAGIGAPAVPGDGAEASDDQA